MFLSSAIATFESGVNEVWMDINWLTKEESIASYQHHLAILDHVAISFAGMDRTKTVWTDDRFVFLNDARVHSPRY